MSIAESLSSLALGPLVESACHSLGDSVGAGLATGVVALFTRQFTDHSQRLASALAHANSRAWKALELALAGDTFWERCKVRMARAEDQSLRNQVRQFLDAGQLTVDNNQRRRCLQELRQARKDGTLTGSLSPRRLVDNAGTLAAFREPEQLLRADRTAQGQLAGLLRQQGYPNLAKLLTPTEGPSLLVVAARYFLRRAIEEDGKLFQGLAFARLEYLQEGQEQGFAMLHQVLSEQGGRIESLLDEVQAALGEVHAAVLDVHEELAQRGKQSQDVYDAVLALQKRFDLMQSDVRPRDSLSIRSDGERKLVREVIARYRNLPQEQRDELPALLNAVGKLEVASGSFEEAGQDFAAVATLVKDPKARAEAHANAYRAALEAHDWDVALAELQQALLLDASSHAPFPLAKYQPLRILGAGGSGVAFLCQHKQAQRRVVIKTLLDGELDQGVEQLFAEARALRELNHPGIVRLLECGFTDPQRRSRPYLATDYFDGVTLETFIIGHGPLHQSDFLPLARQVAEALQAAHDKGLLHRDIKPANVLVRRDREGLRIQLIDFGLALKHEAMKATMLRQGETLTGTTVAGTLDYAPPEQMNRLSGVQPDARSDVFGFGKTCCYALFQTAQPVLKHWRSIPASLAELLGACVEELPQDRPGSFTEVIRGLEQLDGTATGAAVEEPEETGAEDQDEGEVTDVLNYKLVEDQAPPRSEESARLEVEKRAREREDERGGRGEERLRSRPAAGAQRRRHEEEEEWEGYSDEPRRRRRPSTLQQGTQGKMHPALWVLVGVGVLLLIVGVVLAVVLGGKGNDPAVAGWPRGAGRGNPRPTLPQPKPAVSDPEAVKIYLSDLEELEIRRVPFTWHFGKNGNLGYGTGKFKVNGWESPKGLSSHPERDDYAGASYRIPAADVFECLVGLADSASDHSGGPIVFEVLGDSKVLWRSAGVGRPGKYQDCRISVKGVKVLELRAYAPRDGNMWGSHVVWIDPYVTRPGSGTRADARAR
jgi:serine/threonine protein kinase